MARVRGQPSGGNLQPDRSRSSRLAYPAHCSRQRGGGTRRSRYGTQSVPRTITGPDVIRLPYLTSKLLDAQGDQRHVRTADPPLAALAGGALLAPDHAVAIGPTVDTWPETIKALA